MDNQILEKSNQSVLDNNDIELAKDIKLDEKIQENTEKSTNDNIILDANTNSIQIENTEINANLESNIIEEKKDKINNQIDNTTDCLALTVKKDYQFLVIQNLFRKGIRLSWKVAFSVITINLLNLFL